MILMSDFSSLRHYISRNVKLLKVPPSVRVTDCALHRVEDQIVSISQSTWSSGSGFFRLDFSRSRHRILFLRQPLFLFGFKHTLTHFRDFLSTIGVLPTQYAHELTKPVPPTHPGEMLHRGKPNFRSRPN